MPVVTLRTPSHYLAIIMNDDLQTEINTNRRLRRKARRKLWREQYYSKNGEVVKYLPVADGYLVISGGEQLATLRYN